jgi:hypothetical protein
MKYKIEYNGQELEFDSKNKAGEIKDKIDGTTRVVPIFMVYAVSEDASSSEDIKKKVDDALLDTTFASMKGEKGIKILEDRTGSSDAKDKKKSKNNETDEKNKLHFVELKILGRNGDGKTGFNPGQWRAIGVLDLKSKGFDEEGKNKSVGAIYLFETTNGKKDKTKETEELTKTIKELYKGDCKPGNSTERASAGRVYKNQEGRRM